MSTVESLIDGDHARGCQGREYTCSCGYDDFLEKRVEELEDLLEAETGKVIAAKAVYQSYLDEMSRAEKAEGERDAAYKALAGAVSKAFCQGYNKAVSDGKGMA